jgi:hypothetical protein
LTALALGTAALAQQCPQSTAHHLPAQSLPLVLHLVAWLLYLLLAAHCITVAYTLARVLSEKMKPHLQAFVTAVFIDINGKSIQFDRISKVEDSLISTHWSV